MRMWSGCCVVVCGLSLLLSGSPVSARVLESPADGALVSGLGFISGWKCQPGQITVTLDGGRPLPVATAQPRADTRGVCGTLQNGFIAQMNWNHLRAGRHTAVAYDDGVAFARSTFTVGTAGTEFLRAVEADARVADFPTPGSNGRFTWNESTQHLELAEAGAHVQLVASGDTDEVSVEQWAAEWVDTCYRRADQLLIGTMSSMTSHYHEYQREVELCIRLGAKAVGRGRLWRDRYVRDLVQKVTEEAESLEAWFLDGRNCHPSGDIDPDVYGDEGSGDDGCGLFDPYSSPER